MNARVLNKTYTLLTLSLTVLFFVSTSYAKEGMDKKQKVQKYRVTQISEQDVTLDDTNINTILQSDKIQNLLKNENSKSEDFRIDYPTADRVDYPKASRVDFPTVKRVDYPKASRVDFPTVKRVDFPKVSKVDFPTAKRVDFRTVKRVDFRTVKRVDFRTVKRVDFRTAR